MTPLPASPALRIVLLFLADLSLLQQLSNAVVLLLVRAACCFKTDKCGMNKQNGHSKTVEITLENVINITPCSCTY